MGRLSGKVAVVTGGASGIGRAIVETFAAEGAHVLIVDIQESLGSEVARRVHGAVFQRADVTREEDVASAVARAVSEFGSLDVMVNNAGGFGERGSILELTGDGFDRLSATLDLRDGKAHTQDFRLVTPFYEVRLAGAIALADLGLDAKGEIALGSELAGALLGDLPLAKLAPKQLLVIPLPAIRGTLVEPEPEPDWRMLERALLGNLGGVVEGAGDLLKGVGKGLLGR